MLGFEKTTFKSRCGRRKIEAAYYNVSQTNWTLRTTRLVKSWKPFHFCFVNDNDTTLLTAQQTGLFPMTQRFQLQLKQFSEPRRTVVGNTSVFFGAEFIFQSTLNRCFKKFASGHFSLSNEPRGWPGALKSMRRKAPRKWTVGKAPVRYHWCF